MRSLGAIHDKPTYEKPSLLPYLQIIGRVAIMSGNVDRHQALQERLGSAMVAGGGGRGKERERRGGRIEKDDDE